jgi:hypothetical protein
VDVVFIPVIQMQMMMEGSRCCLHPGYADADDDGRK